MKAKHTTNRTRRGEAHLTARDIMTPEPRVCSPRTNLAEAGALMLEGDCGILPVVDEGKLVGVVTDRDLYIALATRNTPASQVTAGDVMQAPVYTCGPEDDVNTVLQTMKDRSVRRLPVEGFGGTVLGIVSMNDILLGAEPRQAVDDAHIVATMQTICAHHHPQPHIDAA